MMNWIILLSSSNILLIGIIVVLYIKFKDKNFKETKQECFFKKIIVNAQFQAINKNKKSGKLNILRDIDEIHTNKLKQLISEQTDYWNNLTEDWYFLHPINSLIEIRKIDASNNYEIKILNLEKFEITNRLKSLQTAVEQNAATIVITDINANIKYVNKKFTKLTQYTKEEAIGQNPRILNAGYQSEEFYQELWETINTGKIWNGEFHNKKKDGTLYWEKALITPILNSKGEINSYIAIKEDITDLKVQKQKIDEYIEKLENLNSTKDKLFSIIAHDLKNPFSVLQGIIELLDSKKEHIKDTSIIRYINLLSLASGQFHDLLTQLLTWSRSQRGIIKPNSERVEVSELLDKQIPINQSIAKRKGVFIQNVTFPPIYIFSDTEMLATIFRNVINNAVKFSEAGDIVRLNTYSEKNKIYIEIKDEGIGMTIEQIQKFYKNNMDSTYGTANEKGTGVGLSVVMDFAKMLKLEVKIESQLNKGTSFIFIYDTDNIEDSASLNN